MATHSREGYLRKNHAGSDFGVANKKRSMEIARQASEAAQRAATEADAAAQKAKEDADRAHARSAAVKTASMKEELVAEEVGEKYN